MLVSFDPSVGSEAAKMRPAVVVSNNTANAAAARTGGVITVAPVTSNISRIHPFQVLLTAQATGLPRDSKAQAEQLRAVSVSRIRAAVGWVPTDTMRELDAAIRLHLSV